MRENIVSGGLFEENGPTPLVEGPLNRGGDKIPLSEYERFLKGTQLKEGPLQKLWVQGMWNHLGLPGTMNDDFFEHVMIMAKLAYETPMKKVSPKYKFDDAEDWNAKAALFRASCNRAKTRPDGSPWVT